jgi:hypothetical protein
MEDNQWHSLRDKINLELWANNVKQGSSVGMTSIVRRVSSSMHMDLKATGLF